MVTVQGGSGNYTTTSFNTTWSLPGLPGYISFDGRYYADKYYYDQEQESKSLSRDQQALLDRLLTKHTPPPPATPKKGKKSDKEKTEMASNVSYSYEDLREIDDAVREAIIKPRKDAEIANRLAAVQAIGAEDTYAVGTVLTFNRKQSGSDKVYSHVALKAEGYWCVAGGLLSGRVQMTYNDLITWMTTGDAPIVTDVKVATAFETVAWTPAPVVPSQASTANESATV